MIQKCHSCKKPFDSDGHTHCDACRDYMHKWYLDNKKHRQEYVHDWYLDNRETEIERSRNWYQDNGDIRRAARRAKLDIAAELGVTMCSSCLKEFESHGYKHCPSCREKKKEEYDSKYRSVWEEHFKVKIPEGYVIHHKDGDREHNDPHNLLCLPVSEHARLHWIKGDRGLKNIGVD